MLTRRHFLGASLAMTAYAGGSMVPAWAQNAPSLGTPTLPSPGWRRTKVGDAEVIALIDGIARRPLGEEFVKNAPLAEVRALQDGHKDQARTAWEKVLARLDPARPEYQDIKGRLDGLGG